MTAAERLYSAVILDHVRNPRNWGNLDPADFSYEDGSAVCGDEIRIDVRVNDDRIAEIAFTGRGCAVSQAAASILTAMAEGMSLDRARALTETDLLAEIGSPIGCARLRCALLSLSVLQTGLRDGGRGVAGRGTETDLST
jgi:nitrogen fixation NifU-like protein